jgi:hypothetical protein
MDSSLDGSWTSVYGCPGNRESTCRVLTITAIHSNAIRYDRPTHSRRSGLERLRLHNLFYHLIAASQHRESCTDVHAIAVLHIHTMIRLECSSQSAMGMTDKKCQRMTTDIYRLGDGAARTSAKMDRVQDILTGHSLIFNN